MRTILIATGIYEPDIGGPASFARVIAPDLAETNAVTLVTYSSVRHYAPDSQQKFKVIRIWRSWPKLIRHIFYTIAVLRNAKKADMLFALSAMNAGLTVMVVSRLFKKDYVVRVAGDYAWETAMNRGTTKLGIDEFQKAKRTGRSAVLHKLQTLVCQRATRISVQSHYFKNIVHGWGVPLEKIHVVNNGVEFKKSELSQEQARKQLAIAGTLLVSVGRLVPWKGFRMLIKIMPKLLTINPFARLVIIGSGPDEKYLASMVRHMGLDRKVFLVGQKSHAELAVYLAAADVFVQNTGYEGFSHQLVEALCAGVPVITTEVGGNPELIDQGKNGFMVRYNDEFEIIEAIKALWSAPAIRAQFIAEGYRTAQRFTIKRMIDETKAIL